MRETLSAAVAWLLLYQMLNPLGLQFLQTIVFNLVIAFPIQLLEIVMKKTLPSLYQSLRVFLPLFSRASANIWSPLLFRRS